MMDAIIIDDEKKAITTLSNDLAAWCPEVRVQAAFTKASEAISFLQSHTVHLVFLDIEMPVINGFDFINTLPPAGRPHIIFVTAYNEFAIRAIKVGALDYLLKPVDPVELQSAVRKVMERDSAYSTPPPRAAQPPTKLALPVNNGYHMVEPSHIIYCKAAGAYTQIVMDNEKSFLISRNLGRTQEMMPLNLFERVHQSFLVNVHHIKHFRKGESPEAIMVNNDVIKVSRSNKEKLSRLLGIG